MTSGSLLYNGAPFMFFMKAWDGDDWSSPTRPLGMDSYWTRLDRAISDAESPSFVKVVGGNHRQPSRKTREEHAYFMIRESWFSNPGRYQQLDFSEIPPAVLGPFDFFFSTHYDVGYSSTFGSAWNPNDEISLLGKLREKIVGSDFNMGNFLGEGKEALSMIASSAVRVRKYLQALRRGDIGAIARAFGSSESKVDRALAGLKGRESLALRLAQANLALQYGWLPLLQDAHGAAQALAQQLNNPAVQTYRARFQKPLSASTVSSNIAQWTYEGFARGQLIARLTEVDVAGLNGLVDPSSVLWEVTPWSFVADWFIPIGSYLTARSLSSFTSGTYTKTISYVERFRAADGIPKGPAFIPLNEPSMSVMRTQVRRSIATSLEVPLPNFKTLAEVPSWKRAANAVSLLLVSANRWR